MRNAPRITDDTEDVRVFMPYVKKTRILITAVLLFSVLLAGCENDFEHPDTAPFPEKLVGIYKTHSEENGETVMQIYRVQNRLIAEAEEEYAAYYAMEWIPVEAENTDTNAVSGEYTVYTFSGFSDYGEYRDSVYRIRVVLTDTGLEITDEKGNLTAYTRDSGAEPIHIPERYEWFIQENQSEIIPDTLLGEWTGYTDDGYTMLLQLEQDGNAMWYCKKDGEPVCVHIGVAAADCERGTIKTVTEKVGWGDMPWLYDIEYTFGTDGKLLLKNPESGGILPVGYAVGFIKSTGKEG